MGIIEIISGVLTGGLGSIISRVLGIWETSKKAEIAAEERKATFQHELALHKMNMEIAAEETERELALAESAAASAQRLESYKHDTDAGKGSQFVINMLRLVRPMLTIMLIVLVGITYYHSVGEERVAIADSVVYMCGAAIGWWFGDRGQKSK